MLISYIYITEGGGSNFIIAILKFVLLLLHPLLLLRVLFLIYIYYPAVSTAGFFV